MHNTKFRHFKSLFKVDVKSKVRKNVDVYVSWNLPFTLILFSLPRWYGCSPQCAAWQRMLTFSCLLFDEITFLLFTFKPQLLIAPKLALHWCRYCSII